MPVRNTITIAVAAIVALACYEKATHNRYASTLTHAMDIIEDNYVEEVKPRELFENAMKGMVNNLDEYSDYIGPDYFQQFQQSLDQEFVGIGVVVEGPPDADELRVVTPVFDSPAYRSGMRAGDLILEIDGVLTRTLTLNQAVKKMKGPPGTTVEVVIQHDSEEESVRLVVERQLIRTKSVLGETLHKDGQWNYFLEEDPRIGYVRISTFGERTVEELSDVIRFRGHPIEALILDLRGNVGGLLEAAVETSDMFISEGVIVSTRGRRERDDYTYVATPQNTVFDPSLPMVVLVDRYAASASEIVAACLQDHKRAIVVGQRTWGKGTVQNVIPLERNTTALKLTTASYWRPSGKNIHRGRNATEADDWGVRPTKGFEVILTEDQYRALYEQRRAREVLQEEVAPKVEPAPEISDPQMQRAVDHLKQKLKSIAA